MIQAAFDGQAAASSATNGTGGKRDEQKRPTVNAAHRRRSDDLDTVSDRLEDRFSYACEPCLYANGPSYTIARFLFFYDRFFLHCNKSGVLSSRSYFGRAFGYQTGRIAAIKGRTGLTPRAAAGERASHRWKNRDGNQFERLSMGLVVVKMPQQAVVVPTLPIGGHHV